MNINNLDKLDKVKNSLILLLGNLKQEIGESFTNESDKFHQKPTIITEHDSVANHLRHIIEFIQAILQPDESGIVDYSTRKRDENLVKDITAFETSITSLQKQLGKLDKNHIITYKIDTLPDRQQDASETNLKSELMSATAHTTHHMAIIKVTCELLGITLSDNFGKAGSTISHEISNSS